MKLLDGIKNVRNLIVGLAIIMVFLYINNPQARDVLIPNFIFLAIAFLVYQSKSYQDYLIGIPTKNILMSGLYGLIAVAGFWFITKFVPGMSLAYPLLPQAISETMKFFAVVILIPPIEEIFFRGVLLGYIRSLSKKSTIWIPIIVSSAIFSIFHLTAYIQGWYRLPDIASAIGSIGANASVFITAFLFGVIASFFVLRKGIKNLAYSTVFHMGMNALAYSLAVITFI